MRCSVELGRVAGGMGWLWGNFAVEHGGMGGIVLEGGTSSCDCFGSGVNSNLTPQRLLFVIQVSRPMPSATNDAVAANTVGACIFQTQGDLEWRKRTGR
jgi:hypothetical protein